MKKALPYFLPLIVGLALLPIPLLRDLHFESAMLAGTVGCFWVGIRVIASTTKEDFFGTLRILGLIYLAAIPLFIFSLISGCLTLDGIVFWIFVPLPGVFLGAGVGRLIREFNLPFPKTITIFILLFCGVGIWILEFFTFPQVYFFNHVWGYWPGPIYDEAVSLTGSFLYFRWITFLWIILLWILPVWSRNVQSKFITVLALVSLMFSYLYLDEAGIISPTKTIQKQLGSHLQTEHFEVYFDEEFYSQEEIEYWSARHEFHFHQIIDKLKIEWPEKRKIESYLYAHAWQKKKITGAKFTSYVPIWLEQDQIHIAKQQLDDVLKHELVHVISKQFGNWLFNGSRSIGLIEGLAEGIAKDASSRSTLHQIVAAEKPWPTANKMRSALSFVGFYGSAGSISYTTSGSFVEYLLNEYPVYLFKDAYRLNNFEEVYINPLDSLIEGWHQTLEQTPLDSVDQQISEFIFAQRSLFEKECPHVISTQLQLWDNYRFHLANNDTTKAHLVMEDLFKIAPENALIKSEWVRVQLLAGNYDLAANEISSNDSLLTLQVLKADALFLSGHHDSADSVIKHITPKIEESKARTFKFTLQLRENHNQWEKLLSHRYMHQVPGQESYHYHNYPNQMLVLQHLLDQRFKGDLTPIAKTLLEQPFNEFWFDLYVKLTHWLIYKNEFDLADKFINNIESHELRLRYTERLNELKVWFHFHLNNN